MLLEWKPALAHGFYYVVISIDPDGKHPVRQYFTADPKLDLRAIDGKLTPGTTYYWRVDAIGPDRKIRALRRFPEFCGRDCSQGRARGSGNLIQLASLGIPTIAAASLRIWLRKFPVRRRLRTAASPISSRPFPRVSSLP